MATPVQFNVPISPSVVPKQPLSRNELLAKEMMERQGLQWDGKDLFTKMQEAEDKRKQQEKPQEIGSTQPKRRIGTRKDPEKGKVYIHPDHNKLNLDHLALVHCADGKDRTILESQKRSKSLVKEKQTWAEWGKGLVKNTYSGLVSSKIGSSLSSTTSSLFKGSGSFFNSIWNNTGGLIL